MTMRCKADTWFMAQPCRTRTMRRFVILAAGERYVSHLCDRHAEKLVRRAAEFSVDRIEEVSDAL